MSELNFSKARNGYNPPEVDAVIAELQRQMADLKQQNGSLSDTIAQFNDKVRLLAENTKRLEDERAKESLRLTGFFNQAAQMTEQTELEAQQKAKEIVENAQREIAEMIGNTRQEAAVILNSAKQEAGEIIGSAKQDAANITQTVRQNAEEIAESAKKEAWEQTESAKKEAAGIIESAHREAGNIRHQAEADFVAAQVALNKLDESAQAIRQSNECYITEAAARLAEIDSYINLAKKGIGAFLNEED